MTTVTTVGGKDQVEAVVRDTVPETKRREAPVSDFPAVYVVRYLPRRLVTTGTDRRYDRDRALLRRGTWDVARVPFTPSA